MDFWVVATLKTSEIADRQWALLYCGSFAQMVVRGFGVTDGTDKEKLSKYDQYLA